MTLRAFTCAAVLSLSSVGATLTPSPVPSATPSSLSVFSAAGSMSLKAAAKGKDATLQLAIRIEHRGFLTRVDLDDIVAVANAGNGKGNVTIPIPRGTLDAIIDQGKRRVTLWSSRRALYYQSQFPLSLPSSPPFALGTSPLGELRALTTYRAFTMSLNLVGHQSVNGHMASVFELQLKTERQGGTSSTFVGHWALADDLSGIPLHVDLTIDANEKATVTMQMDVSSISTSEPPQSEFAPPRGYKRTPRLTEILTAMAPVPSTSPTP